MVQVGCFDQTRAADAEAMAVASLVPLVLHTPVPPMHAWTKSSPGAVTSISGPHSENELRLTFSLIDPTATTPGVEAGKRGRLAPSPSLPAAAKISFPLSTAYFTAASSSEVSTPPFVPDSACPIEMLMTFASESAANRMALLKSRAAL